MRRLRHWLVCVWPVLCLLAGAAHAATVIWSDNFETNASGYWTPNVSSVWRVGSPAGGPPLDVQGYRAHSGAMCAFTGNYKANTDARIICYAYNGATTLLIPTNSVQPRLRFWHWFNIQNALGFVEISTNNGGTWNQISPTYENITGSGVWSRPSVDLSAYEGLRVMFAFRFYGSGTGNGLGWYVDDVEVDSGAENEVFPEGFEFDAKTSDWSEDFGTWEIGYPASGPDRAHTGTNCAATVLGGNYGDYVNSRLISPWFVVPTNAVLTFWHWYNFNDALGFVEINDGSTVSSCTTQTLTTNMLVAAGINTNIYLFTNNVTNPLYTNQFVYDADTGDSQFGGWTNGDRILGLGFAYPVYSPFAGDQVYFEAGIAPLPPVPFQYGVVDYISLSNGVPQPGVATNFFAAMQGMVWTNLPGNPYTNVLIGCFATNYIETNTTYTVTNCTSSTWSQISPTWENGTTGGAWTNVNVNLSAYAGQMVQLAFHFGSIASPAPGWYVDDLSFVVPPTLTVPDFPVTVEAGSELVVTNSATNTYVPNALFTFSLLSAPSGVKMTNGVVTWQTSPDQPSSTNNLIVAVTDNTQPPLSATNTFVVIVDNPLVFTVPPATNIYAGQTLNLTVSAFNGSTGDSFTYYMLSRALTNLDTSDLSVDGNLNWYTTTTQPTGVFTITLAAIDDVTGTGATNSFTVTILHPTPPTLTLPGSQTIYAGQTLTVTNIYASNSNFPDASYTYTLTNSSPPDAVITTEPDNTATITWATAITNKTVGRTFTVRAMDDNTPPLTVSGNFVVTVLLTPAPVLTVPGTLTNYPGQQLSAAIFVTNAARPDATYTFGLPSPSTNVMVTKSDVASAVLTWTNTGLKNNILTWTNNSVAPGSKTVYVEAQDNDWPGGLVTNHFTMVFVAPRTPQLVPTNITIYAGQTFTNAIGATNYWLPGTNFSFALLAVSTNSLIKSNMLAWTNFNLLPGIYAMPVKVTDTSIPPLKNTNSLEVIVGPWPSQLNLTNFQAGATTGHKFKFTIATPWTNTPWRIEASANLAAAVSWQPIFTNHGGTSGGITFTDVLSTNFPQRYYRAVFP